MLQGLLQALSAKVMTCNHILICCRLPVPGHYCIWQQLSRVLQHSHVVLEGQAVGCREHFNG